MFDASCRYRIPTKIPNLTKETNEAAIVTEAVLGSKQKATQVCWNHLEKDNKVVEGVKENPVACLVQTTTGLDKLNCYKTAHE